VIERALKRVNLVWYGPYSVADLSEKLKQRVSSLDRKYLPLEEYGFYMYLNQSLAQAVYIGQASGKGRSLRNRLRWEITKDFSRLSRDLREAEIHKLNLTLKVSHIARAADSKYPAEFIDVSLLNDIENALICQMKPCINRKGKRRYRGETIEIINTGSFAPLPERFRQAKGHSCQ